jgi:hypothetical protein
MCLLRVKYYMPKDSYHVDQLTALGLWLLIVVPMVFIIWGEEQASKHKKELEGEDTPPRV